AHDGFVDHPADFFISSRRRHTRCYRDWSSDVCSSDLAAMRRGDLSELLALGSAYQIYDPKTTVALPNGRFQRQAFPGNIIPPERSEERRVGKESRSRALMSAHVGSNG